MKTSKEAFEIRIKKQIDEREISPSRSLWAEIEVQIQTPEEKHTKKINWFLGAACLILLVSLGTVLFFNKNEKSEVFIAEKNTLKPTPTRKAENKTPPERIIKSEKSEDFRQNSELFAAEKTEVILPVEKAITSEILPSNQVKLQISMLPAEKILAKTDSLKTQKHKKYVDPATLLFSVEHKDAIEQTKDGSNVAKFDLNSK